MANNDVIELGSSDEETEPAPKRRRTPLNAMVHIPGKFPPPGITATTSKNTKSKINPASILKGSIGQAVTVTKISKTNVNPYANKNKLNGNVNPVKTSVVVKPVPGIKRNAQIPVQRNANISGPVILPAIRKVINPFGRVAQKPSPKNVANLAGANNVSIVRIPKPGPVKIGIKKPPLVKPNLPPDITIKRTTPPKGGHSKSNISVVNRSYTVARINNAGAVTKAVKRPAKPKPVVEVPTVNLDDDELTVQPVLGPQWYLRPEDQYQKENKLQHSNEDPLAGASPTEIPLEKSPKTPDKSASESDSTLETQNNKEPDKTKYIEITIEDSPVKPRKTKKGFKVGAELAITIEDSPVKTVQDEIGPNNTDDDEEEKEQCNDRNSKKKLEYPKTVQTVQVVEVEFEPFNVQESTNEDSTVKEPDSSEKTVTSPKEQTNTEKNTDLIITKTSDKTLALCISDDKIEKPKKVFEIIDIVEIEESPVKPPKEVKITTPKKNKPTTKPAFKISREIETIDLDDKEKDEFSPIYQSFIDLCLQLENSDDMKKIVEKKIKAYYRQVPKEYTESETFTDLVAGKIMAMKAGPEKMYLYIKDVVDELNLQRKLARAQPAKEKEEQQKFLYGEESEFDAKRQRQIRKLEKTLKKLHRAIQKLEEQEVDFDDEEDSVYLLTESEDDTSAKDSRPINKEVLIQRYKERSVRVHAKLCQLTNTKMPSEARVQIEPRPGQPKGPAKRIEKWINRKVPIGTPLPFPDFHDVLRCVREANQEDNLGWNEADVMEEARDLFVRCGKKLQRRRQENEWRLAASRIPADNVDPAEDSTELQRKLEENKRMAANKETEVFNKYADRQNQLNLEAVEIGDKEAEESPIESDEEDPVDVTDSLTDKKKRKERLKRLIQEKSKVSDNKVKQPDQMESDKSLQDGKKDSNEVEIGSKDVEEDAEKDPIETILPDKEPPKCNDSDKESKVELDSVGKKKGHENEVDSDIDELHLLEKLYSDNDYNSVVGTSDTASLIAISDTSSDEKHTKKSTNDIISIENSSYSESEEKIQRNSRDSEAEDSNSNKIVEKTFDANMEVENSADGIEMATNITNNEESETCINLDDNEASKLESSDKNTITDGSSVEAMEIGTIEINSEDQNRFDGIVETLSEESLEGGNNTKIASSKSPKANENNICPEITNKNSAITADTETCINLDDNEASKHKNSDITTLTGGSSVEAMEIATIKINSKDQNRLDVKTLREVESLEGGNKNNIVSCNSPHVNEKICPAQITHNNSAMTADTEGMEVILQAKSKENVRDENVNESGADFVSKTDDNRLHDTIKTQQSPDIQSVEDISMEEILEDTLNLIENVNKGTGDAIDEKTLQNNDVVTKEYLAESSEDIPMKEIQDVKLNENTNEKNETENNKDLPDAKVTENTNNKHNETENNKELKDAILSADENNERENNKDVHVENHKIKNNKDTQDVILHEENIVKNNDTENNTELQDAIVTENIDKKIERDDKTDIENEMLTENSHKNNERKNDEDIQDAILTDNNDTSSNKDTKDETLTENTNNTDERSLTKGKEDNNSTMEVDTLGEILDLLQ